MNRWQVYSTLLLSLFLLAGCAQTALPADLRWASAQGMRVEQAQAGEEFYFTVPVDRSILEPETIPVRIQVSGKVNNGGLRFELRGPDGEGQAGLAWTSGDFGPGDFSATTNFIPGRDQTGEYHLGLVYQAGTSARYNLSWHALKPGPAMLVPGTLMLLVGLAFLAYGGWRRLGWRYFGLGALFWGITVAVKFAFAAAVSPGIYQLLKISQTELFSPGNLVAYIYIGSLTGFFEAGLAWLILRRSRWGRATWEQALAFGIGFGVIEALLLALSSLGGAIAALAAPDSLPVPTLASLARSADPLMAPAPAVERLFVILAHIFACVLLFYAIACREKKWVWLAILYKTILDTPAGFAAIWGITTPGKLWTIEALIALTGLLGLWGLMKLSSRYPREAVP
jgi:uncharacterized membrane protein YhfC